MKKIICFFTVLALFVVNTSGQALPPDSCIHTVSLTDTYGDGWNGGTITISLNGVPLHTDITLAGGSGPEDYSFYAEPGDIITIVRTDDGSYPAEMQVEVFDGGNNSLWGAAEPTASVDVTAECPPPSCTDGILNQNETSIDCGGVCPDCPTYNPVGDTEPDGANCYQLTDGSNNQNSALWYDDLMDLSQPIDIVFTMNFGCDEGGADGMVFVMQTAGNDVIGADGQGLGFSGFSPSLGVEFDIYPNGDENDINNDHIGILTNGVSDHNAASSLTGAIDVGQMEDCADHQIRITWDPTTQDFNVYYDCAATPTASVNEDIINNVFGGIDQVYWGFTGATGGLATVQEVCLDPNIFLETDTVYICDGATEQLSAPDGTSWTWTPSTFLDDASSQNPNCSVTSDILYTVQYSDICGRPQTFDVQVLVGVTPEVDITPNVTACVMPVILDADVGDANGVGVNYLWTPTNETTETISTDTAGTFYVEVTNANGGCPVFDQVNVTVIPGNITTTGSQTDLDCNGDADGVAIVNLDVLGTAPYTYAWSTPTTDGPNNNTSSTVTDLSGGLVDVTITDAMGCQAIHAFIIIEPAAMTIGLTPASATCGDANGSIDVTVTNGATPYDIDWAPGAQANNQNSPYTISGLTPQSYNVTVTDANGCSLTDNATVLDAGSVTANIAPEANQCLTGKTIYEGGEFVSITVHKGGSGAAERAGDLEHGVDAISGGTITSKGLEEMVKDCLINYDSYFKNNKKQ
jgi:hypothetical protein